MTFNQALRQARDELIAKEKAKDATGALSGPSEGGVAARRRRRVAE